MSQDEKFSERLYAAQNPQELRNLLKDVNERSDTDEEFQPRRIRLAIYTALRDTLGEDEAELHHAMYALWSLGIGGDCEVEPSRIIEEKGRKVYTPSRSQEDVWERSEARALLGKWVSDLVAAGETRLREEFCRLSCEVALNRESSLEEIQAAIWTLGEIGWRSEQVQEVLWQLIQQDNLVGDLAGGVLVDLGVDATLRESFVAQLRERAKRRPIRFNAYPMQQLGLPELVDDALDLVQAKSELRWFDGKPRDGSESAEFEEDMKQSFLSHMANELWRSGDAQKKIWNLIYEWCRQTEEGRSDLLFTGNLASWCDTTTLVPNLLSVLPDVFEDEDRRRESSGKIAETADVEVDPHHFSIYVATERLKSSFRPKQLRGWVDLKDDVVLPFRQLGTRNTNQTGTYSTSPMDAKEACWYLLACAGGRWVHEEVQTALSDESSGYVKGHIAEIIACFGCNPLPPIVGETLTQPGEGVGGTRDVSEGEDSSIFFACRGMENIARATANREAFEALLGFNFVYQGNVLRSTNDALNEVSAHLVRNKQSFVVDVLWSSTQSNEPAHRRETAISALHNLAYQRQLTSESWPQFVGLSRDENIHEYFRALAVQAIGFFSDANVIEESFDSLRQIWLSNRIESSSSIARSARGSLARHDSWRRLPEEEQELFLSDLKVENLEGQWHTVNLANANLEDITSVYYLYQWAPDEFESAVCDVLESERNEPMYALTYELIDSITKSKTQLSERITQIFISQLHQQLEGITVKRYVFDALAIGAPQALLEENWEVFSWSLEAKAALADALGQTHAPDAKLGNAAKTLETLAHDSSFVVRRSAFRAARLLVEDQLQSWCEQWSESAWILERKMVAEAIFWLDDQAQQEVIDRVLSDCEGSVREAARQSAEANRQRMWADEYLARVEAEISVDSPTELFVYGEALQRVGDEWHIRRLKSLRDELQTPAMRFWCGQVIQGLEKDWRNRTRDWNFISEGMILLHDDAILVVDDRRVDIEIWLWEHPRGGVRSRSSWGGTFRVKDASSVASHDAIVELKDGRRGKISLGNINFVRGEQNESRASFSGQESLISEED